MKPLSAAIGIMMVFVFVFAIQGTNSIVRSTPVYNASDPVMVNESTQSNSIMQLFGDLSPTFLLIGTGGIIVSVILGSRLLRGDG